MKHPLTIAIAVAAFVLGGVTGYIAKPNPNRWDYTVQAGVQKFDRAGKRLWTLGLENNKWFERGVGKQMGSFDFRIAPPGSDMLLRPLTQARRNAG